MINVESIPPIAPPQASPPAPSAAKRRFGLTTLVLVALLSAGAAAAALTISQQHSAGRDAALRESGGPSVYQCPMHPSIIQDHPGECPICGMKLVKVEKPKAESAPPPAAEKKLLFYRSPMDPKQTSKAPRKDEMGMDYLPVYESDLGGPSAVSGLANVEIDAARQQLIGLKTAEVTEGPVGGAWRTVGRVAIDETRVRHVNLKVPGFVERIYVDFVGKKVKQGDPLFSIYSPELLSAQEEYLLALRTRGALSATGTAHNTNGEDLVTAARRNSSSMMSWSSGSASIPHGAGQWGTT